MDNPLDRYTTPRMGHIWSEEHKLDVWRLIEHAVADAQGAPDDVLEEMRTAPLPTHADVVTEEKRVRHDVVAFLSLWQRGLSPKARAWVHKGLTSSDVVDTANAFRMQETAYVLTHRLIELRDLMAKHAVDHQDTIRVARTHGQTAEVSTWGFRIAELTYAVERCRERTGLLIRYFAAAKASGPVGDYKRISHVVEEEALSLLNLHPISASSQIVMRDVYADYLFCLGQIASVIEALALEVRLSARSDTGEVAEGFGRGQRGSSSMPHKRNPIRSEQLSGLARLVRAQLDPVWQGVALHHERDISHSSVERVALVTASCLTDYMIGTATALIDNLKVNKEVMRERAASSPGIGSAHIRERLVQQGVDPDVAWSLVHEAYGRYSDCEFENLTEAFDTAWRQTGDDLKPTSARGDIWHPSFVDLLAEVEDPSKMLGDNRHVFDEMERFFLN